MSLYSNVTLFGMVWCDGGCCCFDEYLIYTGDIDTRSLSLWGDYILRCFHFNFCVSVMRIKGIGRYLYLLCSIRKTKFEIESLLFVK